MKVSITMPALSIAVDCACPFWLTLDDHDGISVRDGRAKVTVERGKHALFWAVRGTPSEGFSAVVRDGDRELCVVERWTPSPEDDGWVGAYVKFES